MKEIEVYGTKVRMWARTLDLFGWKEVMNMAKLPFLPEQGVALMPDAHAGSGVPIGTVLPCIKAVIPTAVKPVLPKPTIGNMWAKCFQKMRTTTCG